MNNQQKFILWMATAAFLATLFLLPVHKTVNGYHYDVFRQLWNVGTKTPLFPGDVEEIRWTSLFLWWSAIAFPCWIGYRMAR